MHPVPNGLRFGLICSLISLLTPAGVYADVLQFFPSKPVHEDDGLTGEYDLKINGCTFEVMEYFPNQAKPKSITHTKIDLSHFITIPFLVGGSGSRFSSRVTVAWFAESHIRMNVRDLQLALHEMRVPLFYQQENLPNAEISQRRSRLRDMLNRIERGEFGEFAQRNHSFRYETGQPIKLNSISVAYAFQLPSKGWESSQLVQAVYEHQLDNCPEIIPSVLDKVDGIIDGQIDPLVLQKLKLEVDPDTGRIKPRSRQ